MDPAILKTVGQISGIGGIALGVFLLLFRDVIGKQIFSALTKQQSFRLIVLFLVLVWLVAIAGIAAWVWVETSPSHEPDLPPKTVSISMGGITLSGPGSYLVATESKANSDDLTKISGLSEGDKVTLKAAHDDRTVVIKEGHYLIMQAPEFSLNNENDKIVFISKGAGICVEDDRKDLGD